MSIKRETLHVDGMTCGACEARISGALLALKGIIHADANYQRGTVNVEYEDGAIDLSAVKAAIERTGYAIRKGSGSGTALAFGIGLLLVAAYLVAGSSGLFSSIPRIDASIGYSMLFAIGLLTSIHCVAMCGGIALSQSVGVQGDAERPACEAKKYRFNQLAPALAYNAGRVLSYTVIGGLVGALGSAFGFSPTAKGVIASIAGLFMVIMGLRMLGALKALPRASSFIPSPIRAFASRASSAMRKGGPFAVGVLNGLMPCGPLQTMQLYALGTGSAVAGAFSMFVFSLGTVPLMLAFGLTAALLPRKLVPTMVKASAVLVMFLGVVTVTRAVTMAGVSLSGNRGPSVTQVAVRGRLEAGLPLATVLDGVQTVVTEFKDGQYVPFAVKAGVPLKWTVRISADELTACNDTLVVPSYGIRKELSPGDNLIEFTPRETGTIAYSCWMGMIRSSITVVENLGNPLSLPAPVAKPGNAGACGRCGSRGL